MVDLEDVIGMVVEQMNSKPSSFMEYREYTNFKNREIYLEDVDSGASREIVRFINTYNRMDEGIESSLRTPITLLINSYGGSITDCYAIIDAITFSKTPVKTKCVGTAYSAGGLILIAGHEREIAPMGSFMFHEGSAMMAGDAGKMKDQMKFYERQLEQMRQFVFKRTKISPELFLEKQEKDWYMTAQEALEYGIVDKIIGG